MGHHGYLYTLTFDKFYGIVHTVPRRGRSGTYEVDGWVVVSPSCSSCTSKKRFRRREIALGDLYGEKHQCRVRRRTPDRARRGAPLWQGGEVGDELSQSRQSDRRRLLLEGWKKAITYSPPRIRVGGIRSRATARTLSIQ